MINIIIPCYHSRETLYDTLKSLEYQTKKIFSTTLVIDGDGEDYSDIISKTSIKPNIITLNKNVGPGLARQAGIDASKMYSHIMFLDSDDRLQPRAIEVLSREAKICDADIISSAIIHEVKYGNSNIIEPENKVWLHGKIYSLKFINDNNIHFSSDLKYSEDVFFNQIAFSKAEKILKVDEPLVIWSDNKNSITRIKNNKNELIFAHKYMYTNILAYIKAFEWKYQNIKNYSIKNNLNDYIYLIKIIYIYYNIMIYTKEDLSNIENDIKNCFKKYFSKKDVYSNNFLIEILYNEFTQGYFFCNKPFLFELSLKDFLNKFLEDNDESNNS